MLLCFDEFLNMSGFSFIALPEVCIKFCVDILGVFKTRIKRAANFHSTAYKSVL